MELKRYSTEELIPLCYDIFYNYMSNEGGLFWNENQFTEMPNGKTPAHMVHEDYEQLLKNNNERIKIYQKALQTESLDNDCIESLNIQLRFLMQEHEALINSSMEYQKQLYEKNHSVDYCRSAVRIPLDKIINSYYDDLILEVVYYDDVSTPKGKFKDYEKLTTREERKQFIMNNTEITHLGFALIRGNNHVATIGIKGRLNTNDDRIQLAPYKLLPHKFSDFENLTLQDTKEIDNNDLRQFFQSKIDLDKENLEKLSSQMIRGDLYEIYKQEDTFFIRYICRSTGRIYYNTLNLSNLALSPEYKKDDCDSYAKAWWTLNTLGGKIEGKEVIRL